MAFTTIAVSPYICAPKRFSPAQKILSRSLFLINSISLHLGLLFFFCVSRRRCSGLMKPFFLIYPSSLVVVVREDECSTLPISLNPKEEENFFSFLLLQSEIIHLKCPTNVHFPKKKDEKPFRKCLKNLFGGP